MESLGLEGVGFSYGDEEVLGDFDLEIERGQILGLMGRSGSGKSTILKLIMRYYDPDSGRLRKNGRDIRDLNTRKLRSSQTYLAQDSHLFKGTIIENLRIAKEDASLEEIQEACKKASIHEFIEDLPQAYESRVGDVLSSLSSGERQRLALARGFLQGGDLILLDEPTSNIDSLNEGIILKSIWQESGDKTVVLVSHKMSTLRIADQIIEIKKE